MIYQVCDLDKKKPHPVRMRFFLVETTGLEPVTPCMSSKYSNQLSYASVGDEETVVETIGLEPMTPCM